MFRSHYYWYQSHLKTTSHPRGCTDHSEAAVSDCQIHRPGLEPKKAADSTSADWKLLAPRWVKLKALQ